MHQLQDNWKVPIGIIADEEPKTNQILKIIQDLNYEEEFRIVLEKNPNNWIQLGKSRIFILPIGISENNLISLIKSLQFVGDIPEPMRIADMFAKAII